MKRLFVRAHKALDFLERHQLEPTATNYAFALHYIASPTSKLAHEVSERTYGDLRLTSEAVLELIERYLSPNIDFALAHRQRTVARQAEELGTLTSDAHGITEALGRDVGAMVKQSDKLPESTSGFVERLSDAERELAELRNELLSLKKAIGISHLEASNLIDTELARPLDQSGARQALELATQRSTSYVMMVFSIDDLIGINNRFGRPVGDNVLNAFAGTLRQVFPEEMLIRWTGNEFILVANDLATMAARLLIEDALTAVRARRLKLRETGEWIGTITASAGIVASQGQPLEVVLARARANTLLAAAQGGDRSEG